MTSGADGQLLVDVRGLNCPIPLLKTKKAWAVAPPGARLVVLATDPDSVLDIRAFAQLGQIECAAREEEPGVWRLELRKT